MKRLFSKGFSHSFESLNQEFASSIGPQAAFQNSAKGFIQNVNKPTFFVWTERYNIQYTDSIMLIPKCSRSSDRNS